jgi:hypothetical protein
VAAAGVVAVVAAVAFDAVAVLSALAVSTF